MVPHHMKLAIAALVLAGCWRGTSEPPTARAEARPPILDASTPYAALFTPGTSWTLPCQTERRAAARRDPLGCGQRLQRRDAALRARATRRCVVRRTRVQQRRRARSLDAVRPSRARPHRYMVRIRRPVHARHALRRRACLLITR